MKKEKIKLILAGICLIGIMSILPTNSQAVVQASGGTGAKKTIEQWMQQIRQMEQAGGALGLTETINSDLTPSTESNNLDCHMEKNTEYGAMAILSASSYGKPDKINNGETTTGNKSGIYILLDRLEVVSGGQITASTIYKGAASKYKLDYTTTYVRKIGDAITETNGWHGGNTTWLGSDTNYTICRGYLNSIFSYYCGTTTSPRYTNSQYTRAVIVVGEGL